MARHAPVFQKHAEAAGLLLEADVTFSWLTPRGHLAAAVQERLPRKTLGALDRILAALNGDPDRLAAKTRGSMRADFVLLPNRVHVEYDEIQHFTTARSTTLALYPSDAALGFGLDAYRRLVEQWRSKGDKGFAHKEAAEFPGPGGRQRQRAYFDAFRDLVAPHFGDGPVLRLAAPDDDYADAVTQLERQARALRRR